MSESDGVEETISQTMRVAITAAARAGEALMRMRQAESQRAAEESQARAQELQERLDAEMLAARSTYRGVDDPAWWASASPQDVAKAYETATVWHDVDEEAARVQARIEAEVLERYGVDLDTTTGDVATKLEERTASPVQEQDRGVDAAVYAAAAERADAPAELAWDSRDRRAETARDLSAKIKDERAVEAKMRADVAQAHPAVDAVRGPQARGIKARPARGAGQLQKLRGLDR
jgi:hypothetical protein